MSIFAELREGVTTRSAAETHRLGVRLGEALPADSILALHGDLGVGKTTFVRGLAQGLGVTKGISSPTFTLFNLHETPHGWTLVHMDAYRLEGQHQVDALMLEDFLKSPFCLVVEWPDRLGDWLPKRSLHLTLSIVEAGMHRLVLK